MWRPLDITGFTGFAASDTGEIRGRSGVTLRPAHLADGYCYVCLSDGRTRKRREYVHRLIAAAFIRPPKPSEDVHHLDGIRDNNAADNLAIVDRDTHRWGEECPF